MRKLALFYGSRCPDCGGYHVPDLKGAKDADFSDFCLQLANELYNGKTSEGTIHQGLYEATAEKLMQGVTKGLGGKSFGYDDNRNLQKAYFEHNIFAFSAAKSLTELKTFNALMYDENGKKRPFAQFRDAVADTGAVFNVNYLETEWNTAEATAQTTDLYNQFGEYDFIQVSTVHDSKVRPWHARLDGFTAPKSWAGWRRLCPPFDWGCRCTLIPGVAAKAREAANVGGLLDEARVPKYFQRNPAITKVIYKDDHPYFHDSFKDVKELTAEKVYNMPSVQKIYAGGDLPDAVALPDKQSVNDWWKEQAGSLRGTFDVKDKLGNTIRLDSKFKNHVIEDNHDERHRYIANSVDILKAPDEVWSQMEKGKLVKYYLKYYSDVPYAVRVNEDRAFTMNAFNNKNGKVNEASVNKVRRGVLLHRNN